MRVADSFRFRWVALALSLLLLAGVWIFYNPTAAQPGGTAVRVETEDEI